MTARSCSAVTPCVACRKATEARSEYGTGGLVGIAAGGMVGVGEQRLVGAAGEQRFEVGRALLDPFLRAPSRAVLSFQRKIGAPGTTTAPTR